METDNADRVNSPSILNRWITASRNFLLRSLLEIWVTSMGTSVGFVLGLTLYKYFTGTANQIEEQSWIASVFLLGASFGCFIFGFIISKFGRIIGLLATPALSTVGCILISCTDYFGMLLAGGMVLGVAVGGAFVVSPIYISETVEKRRTGQLALLFHFTFTIGMFLAFVVGYYQHSLTFLYAFLLLVPTLQAGSLPESPMFLLAENREEDALEALKRIHGKAYDCMNKLDELKKRLPNIKIPFCSQIKQCTNWKTLGKICGLIFFQQFSGIMAIIFHNRYILKLALSNINGDSIIISISQVVGTAVAALLITIKLGRRIQLALSIVLVMIVQLLLFIYLVLYIPHVAHSTVDFGWFPVFVLSCFVAAYSLGLGLIPWLTMIELLYAGLTVFGFSAASAFHFVVAFAVVISLPHIGIGGFFVVSFTFGVFALVFIGKLLPSEGLTQAMLDEHLPLQVEDGNTHIVPPDIA